MQKRKAKEEEERRKPQSKSERNTDGDLAQLLSEISGNTRNLPEPSCKDFPSKDWSENQLDRMTQN